MRPLIFTLALLGVALLALSLRADDPAADSPGLAREAVPIRIPSNEKARVNPVAEDAEILARGRLVYSSQCAMCHGATGVGDGDFAKQLGFEVPDLTVPETQARRTDGELFYILTQGHGRMPGNYPRLSDETRWEIVHAVRSYARAVSP
jgi:mono/diheme cytochrome c family protein